jgi:hypothetical protein
MPTPRKVDQLDEGTRAWLKETLRARGFSDYAGIAEALNERLAEDGSSLRLHAATVHRFGQEYEKFVAYQEQASAWAAEWINDAGLEEEARRHGVLFQMITTLAFKAMQSRMGDAEIDARELGFLGKLLKDVMGSAALREKMIEAERAQQAARLDQAVAAGDIDAAAAARAREIMGFA